MSELHGGLPKREYLRSHLSDPTVKGMFFGRAVDVHSFCGGTGFCDLCHIPTKNIRATRKPTVPELNLMFKDQLEDLVWLTCKVKSLYDIQILNGFLSLRPHSPSLFQESDALPNFPLDFKTPVSLTTLLNGVAVDTGITQIHLFILEFIEVLIVLSCTDHRPKKQSL